MIQISSTLHYNPKAASQFRQVVERAIIAITEQARTIAVEAAPRNTGALRNSIFTSYTSSDRSFKGEVSTALPYAVVMEEGRTPGGKFPPMNAIARWVQLKGIDVRIKQAFNLKLKGQALLRAATFLVARKIAVSGIPPKKFFEIAFLNARRTLERVNEALGADALKIWTTEG